MALTNNQRMTLNKASKDFYGLISPADAIKGEVSEKIGNSIISLKTTVFSTPATIAGGITTLSNNTGEVIPGSTVNDINEIKDMIDDCEYLSEVASLLGIAGQVIKNINNASKSILDKIAEFILNIGLTIPEFDISKGLDDITSEFEKSTSGIMTGADKLINCLDILGQGEYTTEVTEYSSALSDLYVDLGMVSNPVDPNWGELDLSAIYSEAGMSPAEIVNMQTVQTSIKSVKSDSVNALSAAIDTTKSMKKLGLI